MRLTQNRRSGLTLTELLVVVAIVVIVTAVLAPLLTSTFEGREVREAARLINVYVQQARAKAKELGRPVGVVIRRSPNNPDLAYQLTLAEEVPPFTGFTAFTRAQVISDYATNNHKAYIGEYNGVDFVRASAQDLLAAARIQPNDRIRFNYRGQEYRVRRIDTDGAVWFDIDGVDTNRHTISPHSPVPFEIYLKPRQSAKTPVELPTGSALVLNLSGVGTGGTISNRFTIGLTEFAARIVDGDMPVPPLTIMFSPSGEVERVFRFLPPVGRRFLGFSESDIDGFADAPPKRPQDKIYLFVGRDGIDSETNLKDLDNLWVTIDQQTGAVNAAPNTLAPGLETSRNLVQLIRSSRQLAQTGQSMGGL